MIYMVVCYYFDESVAPVIAMYGTFRDAARAYIEAGDKPTTYKIVSLYKLDFFTPFTCEVKLIESVSK